MEQKFISRWYVYLFHYLRITKRRNCDSSITVYRWSPCLPSRTICSSDREHVKCRYRWIKKSASYSNAGVTTMLRLFPCPWRPSTGLSSKLLYHLLFLPSPFQCCDSCILREVPTPPLPPTSSNMSARLKLPPFVPYSLHNGCKPRPHFPVHMASNIILRRAHFAAVAGR